jgi:NAD/NADP transhydrogenase beta subunit
LSGLASQTTARQGNMLGILGVGTGILSSLAAVGFPAETLIQFAALSAAGGLAGTWIGKRTTPTELPQMVAALHSVVGLAAVLTSIGSVLGSTPEHLTTLHMVTAYLGVLIGSSFSHMHIFHSHIDGMNDNRRNNIHRFDRRFPQACRSRFFSSSQPPRKTLD